MSDEVAIVGIGMHEFGRNDGVSGMDQGVVAVRRALADAGRQWSDMQFAFGGSMAGGAADTMVSQLGLTGLQFINVANGCATGGSALFSVYNTIESGAATSASPSASTSTSGARSGSTPSRRASATGTGRRAWRSPRSSSA
jgi:acetyl-CoA acetyltransferase